jgi:hypothetical protein
MIDTIELQSVDADVPIWIGPSKLLDKMLGSTLAPANEVIE